MATNVLAKQLRALVEIDKEKREQESKIVKMKVLIQDKKSEMTDVASRISEAKERQMAAKKAVDKLELEANVLREEAKDKREKLRTATKGSICDHLQHELQEIEAKETELEGSLVRAWKELETAQHEAKTRRKESGDIKSTYETEISELENNLAELEGELEKIIGKRNIATDNLDEEWKKRYETMIRTVPDPIVPTVNGLCGSCFYHIIPRDASRLRKGEILTCRSCYRLLYQVKEEKPEEAKPTSEAD
ncbi:zinc ribbon domain-containing protein [Candidatus Dependentiae bacterium]